MQSVETRRGDDDVDDWMRSAADAGDSDDDDDDARFETCPIT